MDWLLQQWHCSCWCTKDSNGQATACRHRHLEVWPQPGSDTTWRTSLARRPFCLSSGQWQFTGVWTATHRPTCRTTAFRSPVSTLSSTFVPPTVNCLQYLTTSSTLMAETRPSVQTLSDVCLKRTCSLDTSAFSALEVLDDNRAL